MVSILTAGLVFHFPVPPVVIRNDYWTWEELCHYLYEENAFDNVVISPGPGSPACSEDIGENHGLSLQTDNFNTFIYCFRRCNRKIRCGTCRCKCFLWVDVQSLTPCSYYIQRDLYHSMIYLWLNYTSSLCGYTCTPYCSVAQEIHIRVTLQPVLILTIQLDLQHHLLLPRCKICQILGEDIQISRTLNIETCDLNCNNNNQALSPLGGFGYIDQSTPLDSENQNINKSI